MTDAAEVPAVPAAGSPPPPAERRLDEVLRSVGDGVVNAAQPPLAAIGEALAVAGPPAQPVRPEGAEPWLVPDRLTAAVLLAAGCPFDDAAVATFKPMAYALPGVSDWLAFCTRMAAGTENLTTADRAVLARVRWLVHHPGACPKTDADCAWHDKHPPELAECAAIYWKHGRLRPCLRGLAIPPCSNEARTVQRESLRRIALREFRDEIFKLEGKVVSLMGAGVGVVLGTTRRLVGFVDWLDERVTRAKARIEKDER